LPAFSSCLTLEVAKVIPQYNISKVGGNEKTTWEGNSHVAMRFIYLMGFLKENRKTTMVKAVITINSVKERTNKIACLNAFDGE
jgi:hypothetical protein